MSSAFDVEAILEEQASKVNNRETEDVNNSKIRSKEDSDYVKKDKDRSDRDRSPDRRRRYSRSRDRDRDRRRGDSRDRRRRSRSRDRRDRDRDRDRSSKDRDRDRDRNRSKREDSAEREALRRQREIDDLTKDQRTLFVGQLTKKVVERDLENFFSQIGKVRSVIMLRDKFTGQHKGFAYVEMAELESVPNCLLFNNVVPDFQKFAILVKASEAEKNFLAKKESSGVVGPVSSGGAAVASMPGQDSRVYVGNIHISLDEVALRAVFEQFGPIESLKLNRDSMGNSKGYAFVKYVSYESAKLAMSSLPSIELLGRYLKVGHVTDHTNRTDPLNIVASLTDRDPTQTQQQQQTNWKLDADDHGQGIAMDATKRLQLMAKLGEKAGMTVPVPLPVLPTVPEMTYNLPPSVVPASQSSSTVVPKAVVPPVGGTLSRCVRIMNMFDPATETQPGWDQDIREDVVDQCANFGRVEHCYVDAKNPSGFVYFRMVTSEAAQKAAENLNGRFFAGRMITATYLDEATYASLAQ